MEKAYLKRKYLPWALATIVEDNVSKGRKTRPMKEFERNDDTFTAPMMLGVKIGMQGQETDPSVVYAFYTSIRVKRGEYEGMYKPCQ